VANCLKNFEGCPLLEGAGGGFKFETQTLLPKPDPIAIGWNERSEIKCKAGELPPMECQTLLYKKI